MITLNGKEKDYLNITVEELLVKEGYENIRVAIELNGEIIRRNSFGRTLIKDGDNVEVVSFVGGG
ncbi:MAG: sulfur carrier protein ThiS [Lachnospiraceae bacterium]|nr:sulfur carrier protein ThiS [Lachnospiraceae bacterium]